MSTSTISPINSGFLLRRELQSSTKVAYGDGRMHGDEIISAIFLIFTGAAVLSGLALYAKQSLLVTYIVLGGLLGPWGFGLVTDSSTIQQIGHIGIIFLLFLLGLNLHPQKLLRMLHEATLVTLASSLLFAVLGSAIALLFGFSMIDSLLIGAMMMFSSTIISLKLLPTTELHHRHMGEIIISVLLLQDIIAIVILLLLQGISSGGIAWGKLLLLAAGLPLLTVFAFLFERYVLLPVMRRFDTIQEYVFLTAIGWCLGIAQLAVLLGLSYEVGAFIAGVVLASNPIARFIAESLKTLRDFLLILFFFSLGASFELPILSQIALPATVMALAMLACKPLIFKWLLIWNRETSGLSAEIGIRLGQISEFALLIAVLAVESKILSSKASYLVQAATLISFILSSYWITLKLPTPITVNDKLRRN